MDWALLFGLVNGFAALAWLILIFAPRRDGLMTLLRDGAVGLLCLLYAVLLINGLFFSGRDGPDFTTIEGIKTIFATDAGVMIGWVHYLAFDLFAGLWVARDSDRIGLSRIVQAPILLATFLFGPFGMLIFLIVRRWHAARSDA